MFGKSSFFFISNVQNVEMFGHSYLLWYRIFEHSQRHKHTQVLSALQTSHQNRCGCWKLMMMVVVVVTNKVKLHKHHLAYQEIFCCIIDNNVRSYNSGVNKLCPTMNGNEYWIETKIMPLYILILAIAYFLTDNSILYLLDFSFFSVGWNDAKHTTINPRMVKKTRMMMMMMIVK